MTIKNQSLSLILWLGLMVTWVTGSCVMLTPFNLLNSKTEESEPTPPAATTANEVLPTALPSQTQPATADWSIETQTYEDHLADPETSVFIQFPVLKNSDAETETAFDQTVQQIYQSEVAAFTNSLIENPPPKVPDLPTLSTMDGGYSVLHATTELVSLTLDFYQYISTAAHPTTMQRTLVFDFQKKRALTLDDVFLPDQDYLTKIADYSRQMLSTRDILFFEEGAAPAAENYSNWLLTSEGFTIIFDVYQVAPYVYGPQQVIIPYSELSAFLQPGILEKINATDIYLPTSSATIEEAPQQ
ncbi:MAG TPA: DUF3298 domain-containing protein [Bellilinea sp.]|nr:DUF3298 domain-containing protein [Bellilinea sp.]